MLHIQHGQLRIEPGSTLDTMTVLNPAVASTYAEAVIGDLRRCTTACRIADPDLSEEHALEQIHVLKNALAPTGSPQLLKACEQLRLDACRGARRAELERRYKAVANAATLLVVNFLRSFPSSINSVDSHDQRDQD